MRGGSVACTGGKVSSKKLGPASAALGRPRMEGGDCQLRIIGGNQLQTNDQRPEDINS